MRIMMGVSSSSWLKHTRRISLILNAEATQSFNNTDLGKKFAGFISRFVDILSPMAVGVAISLEIGGGAMQFQTITPMSLIPQWYR
uniref:Uncharacterized protein n=1 Tax=Helianthus annuus TaxID=4232 RepID=A0A251U9P1_HELAN